MATGTEALRPSAVLGDDAEQRSDLHMPFEWVAKMEHSVHLISIATADLLMAEVPGLLELGHDALRGTFGDADARCDLADQNVGILSDAYEHMGVVGKERPAL